MIWSKIATDLRGRPQAVSSSAPTSWHSGITWKTRALICSVQLGFNYTDPTLPGSQAVYIKAVHIRAMATYNPGMPSCSECGSHLEDDAICTNCADRQSTLTRAPVAGTIAERFEIVEFIGRGGFGEVFKARDRRLGRIVALKKIPRAYAEDVVRRERFWREARAASALNHSNICTVYDLVEFSGEHFIVMEYVEGETLHDALHAGPMPLSRAIPIALQIADALSEAHRMGIVHRDIKPSNIMLTSKGQVKILDFGLAKRVMPEPLSDSTEARLTAAGTAPGTPQFMSPEQILSTPVDQRSDLFSFGVVLYEMLAGQLPFRGSSAAAIVDSVLHAEPLPISDLSPAADKIVRRMLAKDRAGRYATAAEVRSDLLKLQHAVVVPGSSRRRKQIGAGTLIVMLGLGIWGWLSWQHDKRVRWAREIALPQIQSLAAAEKFDSAVGLAQQVEAIIPGEPVLAKLWPRITTAVSIQTTPPNVDVSYTDYSRSTPWHSLGRSPLAKARIPRGLFYRFRFDKPGYQTAWRLFPFASVPPSKANTAVKLDKMGTTPPRMVRVPGDGVRLTLPGLEGLAPVPLDDYLLDQYEVTNAEYKRFVDAGGYRKPSYWKEPLLRDGISVPWQNAMAMFQDTTGRPGPATWEGGSFLKGQDQYPVSGVSWYEAAAYAQFVGKSLPTIYHWNRAAQMLAATLIVPRSNFGNSGTVPVGSRDAMSGFGTFDMAGNVKEWCWNSAGEKRYILGGGWGEADYMAIDGDAQPPWARRPQFGFRCMKLLVKAPDMAARPITIEVRDASKEKPVSDELFRAFESQYRYDKSTLNASIDSVDRSPEDWTLQRISMDAAYGHERLIAYLFLPKRGSPPFQVVVYFPGGFAIRSQKFGTPDVAGTFSDYVVRSGRALLFPIYKSTFERQDDLKDDSPYATALYRDHVIAWYRDMARSIDYLETRKDIDVSKVAYLGLSWGGAMGPIMVALEHRYKAAVFVAGGLDPERPFPEVNQVNFASRVKTPVLMLNGKYDYIFPQATSQAPLFNLLGTPANDKRYVVYPTGHNPPHADMVREVLDWLDHHLGSVH